MQPVTARNHRHEHFEAVVRVHSASLLRLARRYSLCADDAQDAYQRALEIYLRRAGDVDRATAGAWLRTVVKHEAMAVREQRRRLEGDVDLDQWASPSEDGEERALASEHARRAAEALQACKRDEVAAMVLKARGHSYKEICDLTGWSYTKVNRCLTEGRARLAERYAAIESGRECRRIAPFLAAIAGGEAGHADLTAARRHLRGCPACRAELRELQESRAARIRAVPAIGFAEGAALAGRFWESLAASKVAAVAASAVVMAGGGVAVVERNRPDAPALPARTAAPASPRSAGVPTRNVPAETVRARLGLDRAPRRTAGPERPAPPSQRAAPPLEFGFEVRAPRAERALPARPRRDGFGFER